MEITYLKVNQDFKKFQEQLKKSTGSSKGGIYRLYLFKNGNPSIIKRLFSQDSKGVLYIGMTEGTLLKRVCDLQKALVSNSNNEQDSPVSSGHAKQVKNFTVFERNSILIICTFKYSQMNIRNKRKLKQSRIMSKSSPSYLL